MSRRLILALVLAGGVAHADDATTPTGPTPSDAPAPAPGDTAPGAAAEIGDQAVGVEIGVAGGGRVTPGGFRIAGHYLYQLSDDDWFDGIAAFTFGGGGAACFRDRMNAFVCDHSAMDGRGVEISGNVRHMFAAQGQFRPFARAGIGVALMQYTDDDITGIGVPLHGGAGVRVQVAPAVAITAQAEVSLGIARFGSGVGAEPLLGLAVAAGAEFKLK